MIYLHIRYQSVVTHQVFNSTDAELQRLKSFGTAAMCRNCDGAGTSTFEKALERPHLKTEATIENWSATFENWSHKTEAEAETEAIHSVEVHSTLIKCVPAARSAVGTRAPTRVS